MVEDSVFEILVSRFRVLLGVMQQRPKVVRDIVLHLWCCTKCRGHTRVEQIPVNIANVYKRLVTYKHF